MLVFFVFLLLHHETPTPWQWIWATIWHRCLPTIHAQRRATSNVLIRQILAEIFGGIGGWHVVGDGFGEVVVCVPR
jgi:hypothetical protein